jgi:hypothetical protein
MPSTSKAVTLAAASMLADEEGVGFDLRIIGN